MIARRLVALFCLLAGVLSAWAQGASAAPEGGEVVVIPIHEIVDEGMAHLVARAVADAKDRHARAIVLEINTPGGLVDSGKEISDAIRDTGGIPVYAYVRRGLSAGALISLSAPRIVMQQGGSIGAAEPIPHDPKFISAFRAEFESLARLYHRNAHLAGAMVDPSVDAPQFKPPKGILTLTADQARETGFSEATVDSFDAGMKHFGLAGAPRTTADYTWAERIARFATNPTISGLLISLGFLGLLIELQTLHGIAGAIGVAALALFFGTHIYAGFSNGLVVALAIVGVLLILFELHVLPGHGFAGTIGSLMLVAAVVLAFGVPFFVSALQALAIAIVVSVVFFVGLQRVLPENAFVKRLMFAGTQGPDYVASADHRALLGQSGTALSFLRPAGVAMFGESRVDVLTEGDFVPAGTPVRVTRVEGARIFVRPETQA
ncbi:MAG TPA: NfeD family protein [Candidatus Elarobacter sp.]|nr:NfeD family protein [Candidatus Elarobacter sp.]